MIEVYSLTKTYGDKRGIDRLSFSINDGEIVGFLGPNGAGKTTIFNLLTKVYQPTHGTILLDGQDPGAEAKVFKGLVLGTQGLQQRSDHIVRDDGECGEVHYGPCMAAHMRLAIKASPSLYILPLGKTTLSVLIQDFYDFLVVSLIICYKNRFHYLVSFAVFRALRRSWRVTKAQ